MLQWESGWQSGKELDFYPSNQGLTPARVSTTEKKDHQKPPSVPFMTSSRKAYLKNIKKYDLGRFAQILMPSTSYKTFF